jgi:hypothetical protein
MPPIHHDVEVLKQNIHEEIYNIQQHELQTSFPKSVQKNSEMSPGREQTS